MHGFYLHKPLNITPIPATVLRGFAMPSNNPPDLYAKPDDGHEAPEMQENPFAYFCSISLQTPAKTYNQILGVFASVWSAAK
jgi:hypothetical protein